MRCKAFVFIMTTLLNPFANASPDPTLRWKQSDIVDEYHGENVADPYRWLEDESSAALDEFIAWQNKQTSAWIPADVTARYESRLSELINYPRKSVPSRYGNLVITQRNSGLQPHAVVYKQIGIDGMPEVLIDPNAFSEDGSVALSILEFTQDGSLVAYGKSVGGSDNQTVYVRNVATGEDLPEIFTDMRFSAIAWANDNSGFWYNRYPDPANRLNNTIYWHALGTDPSDDIAVYSHPEDPEVAAYPAISYDGNYLVVYLVRGTDPRNGLIFREVTDDRSDSGGWRTLFPIGAGEVSAVATEGSTFFVYTDLDAPLRKLIAADVSSEDPLAWREIIPESDALLKDITMVNGRFLAVSTRDVHSVMQVRSLDGTLEREVELPTKGTVGAVSARPSDKDVYFLFTSYTVPGSIYHLELPGGEPEVYYRSAVKFDSTAYETEQIFVDRDGVKVPVFVTARKGVARDGSNPTILYGYGGFGVSLEPAFNPLLIPWLEAGGVYAVANIRGGGEYGTAWHDAAMLGKRQVAFDDFIAAAETLIETGITRPDRLAIEGGSNGGLLVLVAMQQRPDLFGAVVSQVPVADMLRFHQFGTGRFWTPEYGNAETSREAFEWLKAYSPLHNIREGATYPALLVTTADGDDRVVPAHAFKFIAAIQSAAGEGMHLLRHQLGAGHGGGKPLAMAIREQAEIYAFLTRALNMTGE